MIWKTTFNKITGLSFAKNIILAFLAIFLFSANNAHAQFVPDGNYSASEYAGGQVKDIDLNASGTCEVQQVYSIVKSDIDGPYLLLGFYNGNNGNAIFRYYLDTDPNISIGSDFGRLVGDADVAVQVNANSSETEVFKYNGTSFEAFTGSGIIAAGGDFQLNDGKFIEIKVPLSGDGSIVDICDLAEDFTINLGSYISFAGNSTTSKVCSFENIGLNIDANGSISGGTSYCSGSSNSTTLTLTGNYGAIVKWQMQEIGSEWVDIANTSNTYTANNVSVTTNYRAIIVNETCPDNEVETGIATIAILDSPEAPVVGITQPTCETATGTITVTTVNGLEYSIGGDYQTSGVFSGLDDDTTYNVTAKNADGCISPATSVTIDKQPETPNTPTISATDADCDSATGAIQVISYDANDALTYTLLDENGVAVNNPTFNNGTFTGLQPGTYSVRASNDDCQATSIADTIEDSEQTPDTPTISATDADCDSATGTIQVISYDASDALTYNLIDENGVAVNNPTFSNGTFTGLQPGTYSVRASNDDCQATSIADTIEDSEQTPDTPTISATDADCESATGAIQVISYDANETLTYTLLDENGVAVNNPTFNNGTFTGLQPGTYSVRASNDDCQATSDTDTIEDSQQTPDTPTISATDADCDNSNGAIEVTNFDATLSYILVDSDDNDTEYVINDSGVFADVLPGSYTVRVENNDCEATSTADTIEDSEQTPATPTISATDADCDNSNGAIEVTNFDAALSYILVDSDDNDTEYVINNSGVFANVVPGTYTVRVENNDCNASSETATVSPNAGTPEAPTISATDADCENANGAIEVTNFDAALSYILVDSDDNDTEYVINNSGVFADVLPGAYTVRVKNNDCEATSTADTIEDSEQTPSTPTISATDAACDASGYVTVTNFDNTLSYILVDGDNDTEYAINDSGVFANVVPGTYTVRVENNDCNASSETATVSPNAGTPDAPTISATDADCDSANGAIEVTNFDDTLSYILVDSDDNDTEYVINDSGVFADVLPGSYTVRVENNDCEATSTADTIEDSEQTPTTPTISATDAACDASGYVTVTNFDNTLSYILVDGDNDTEYAINDSGVFANVVPGTYTVRVENNDCNASSETATVSPNAGTPDTPTISATDAACDASGYVTVTNFDNTLSYILVDGDDNDTEYAINDSGVFADVVPGTYTVRVENNDCNASSEIATVSPNAGTPDAPTISAY